MGSQDGFFFILINCKCSKGLANVIIGPFMDRSSMNICADNCTRIIIK